MLLSFVSSFGVRGLSCIHFKAPGKIFLWRGMWDDLIFLAGWGPLAGLGGGWGWATGWQTKCQLANKKKEKYPTPYDQKPCLRSATLLWPTRARPIVVWILLVLGTFHFALRLSVILRRTADLFSSSALRSCSIDIRCVI